MMPDEATTPPPTAMDLAQARQLLESVQNQIRIADEKVRALFGATALIAAALALNSRQSITQIFSSGAMVQGAIIATCQILMALAVAFAMFSAILALMPRLRPKAARRSLFFFGHIATVEHDAFIREIRAMAMPDAIEQVLSQVHVNSLIVQTKYVWAYRSATGFMVAILIGIVVQIMQLFV